MARKGLYLGGSALLLAVVLLLVFWGRPADAEIQVLKAPRAVVWKDFLGVNAQFLWFSPERYNKQIDRLQDLGLEWVRLDLHWDRLETAEDQYQLASLDQLVKDLEARQLKSVFYLVGSARFITTAPFYSPFQDQYPPRDPEVFARRMAMLSQRYPSVAAWQVWNEPNLIGFWRPKADPEGYAKLLQASTIALRMVDPEKPVVSAGMAFFSEMPDGRTMFDALGHLGVESLGTIATYHPYTQLPEGNYPWNLDFVSHANQINRALRNAGVPAIWSTEWGWSAYKGPKELQDIIGVEGQADYVLRRLALMSALDYDRIFLFTLSDLDQRASVRDRDYGLLDLDANPKPVYLALQRFLKVTGPKLRPADPPVTEDLPDGSFSIGWTREDGRNVWLFWSARGGNVRLPGWALPFVRYDQWRYRRWERRVMSQAAAVVAVTEKDARQLGAMLGRPVPVVVNGVDCEHFAAARPTPEAQRVLFLGNYEYAPNVDAVEWMLDEILPRVWAHCPEARMSVCGYALPAEWAQRWSDPRIEWQGFVPDLLQLQSSSSVFLAALRHGGGSKLKVLEALAAGLPLASTAQGVSGLELRDGEDYLGGESAEQLANAVVRLLQDPAQARALGENGRAYVRRAHDWSVAASQLEQVYAGLAEGAPACA